ncbi:MAG: DeoR/GlpR family DNA-binding transcription regulator [Parvibaculaceae bacterium]
MSDIEKLGKRERHDLILNEIRTAAAIRVSELAGRLGVSGETIRRDLAELGQTGLISRTYGGATIRPLTSEPTVSERGLAFVEERSRIGAAAARRIEDGQIVMIDGGTTTWQVARHLTQAARDLTVITNSAAIASAVGLNPNFRVILCPGTYDAREGSVLGEDAVEYLQRFNAHLAVIGATGLAESGPSDAIAGAAVFKRAMLGRAAESMLVIDRSKFGRTALQTVCPLDALGLIITDAEPPEALADAIRRAGVTLAVV